MILEELKNIVDSYIEQGKGKDSVVITLSESSIGARASSGISSIFPGFDWEHGQIRIEPSEDLTSKLKDRDKDLPIIKHTYNFGNRKRNVLLCPKCNNYLRKDDRYCSKCGQKVNTKEIKKVRGKDND